MEINTFLSENQAQNVKGTSAVKTQEYSLDVPKSIHDLNTRINSIKQETSTAYSDFQKLEKRLDRASNFMMWVTGIMAAIFLATSLAIGFDYLKNNEERYEKFIEKTTVIENRSYTKTEIDFILKNFKDCIWFNGLSRCLK
ncbi:MAG: preprotein translocase subunit SecG [Candidatus Andersenbacteria bacterium]|nr:preprotein translocase subunit SecG [Candidatus Andersenbacteria bacterium]